jgi:hypothetical protein
MAWWHWRRDVGSPGASGAPRRADLVPPYVRIEANRLVEECAAFLNGRLVDLMATRRVPVWAWTNLLAHGSAEQLQAERFAACTDDWRRARASLASSLLSVASVYGPLSEIQRRVLVPLEFDLAARPEVEAWGPEGWASAVERALEAYRRHCRPSAER